MSVPKLNPQIAGTAEKLTHHIHDVLPISHEHRQQRSQMQQYIVEFRHLCLQVQQILGNSQMAGAGDGQKLRHTLDQAQQKGG